MKSAHRTCVCGYVVVACACACCIGLGPRHGPNLCPCIQGTGPTFVHADRHAGPAQLALSAAMNIVTPCSCGVMAMTWAPVFRGAQNPHSDAIDSISPWYTLRQAALPAV